MKTSGANGKVRISRFQIRFPGIGSDIATRQPTMTPSDEIRAMSNDQQEFSALMEGLGEKPVERPASAPVAAGWMTSAARWLVLTALFYAPWAYGCTRPWAIHVLDAGLALAVLLWVVGWGWHRRWPHVPPLLLVSSLLLIAQAWWMALAGSIHKDASLAMAQRITALAGAACLVCDLARRPLWRKRLWWAMGLAGASICLLGLAQRLGGANAIFWAKGKSGETFFATFDYHANAGAFINLVWPLIAGLVVSAFQKNGSSVRKSLSILLAAICLAAAFVNTSRGAGALTLLLLIVLVGWLLIGALRGRMKKPKAAAIAVTTVLVAVIIGGLVFTVGFDETVRRWKLFGREISEQNARLQTARVCLRIIPDTGWFGSGPGTFETLFPRYQLLGNYAVKEKWVHAHQDYLQTVIEWGFVGAGVWAVFVFGGFIQSLRARFGGGARWPARDRALYFVILTSLLGVAIHSTFDYPLQVASIQLYVAVLLGMLWSSREWKAMNSRHGGEQASEETPPNETPARR